MIHNYGTMRNHSKQRSRLSLVFLVFFTFFICDLSLVVSVHASTSHTNAPRPQSAHEKLLLLLNSDNLQQHYTTATATNNNNNTIHSLYQQDLQRNWTPPRPAKIHVVPPSPDDTLIECEENATLYQSCGAQRYCATVPGSTTPPPSPPSTTGNDTDNEHNRTATIITPTFAQQQQRQQQEYYCLHKSLWYPSLDGRDMLAIFFTTTCCFLAAMAGIGGGGLILPILLLMNSFTPKEATVLSNTAVFCNALGQFVVNNGNCISKSSNSSSSSSSSSDSQEERNRKYQQQQVIYATVLMIMPGLIAGGSVAITLEGMVPSTVILILAFCTLVLASTKTYYKAQKMRRTEQELQNTNEYNDHDDGSENRIMSPTMLLESPLQSAPERNNRCHQSPQSDNFLMASALEWGSVLSGDAGPLTGTTPGSKASCTSLLDMNDKSNEAIMEEPFFGSIGYLIRSTVQDSSPLIIDESSVAASFDSNNMDESENGERENSTGAHRQQRQLLDVSRSSVYQFVGRCGRICSFCTRHKLELLIGGFWVLDATAFLLLHGESLISIPKCSVGFFALVCSPALIAVIFVSLGRCHLKGLKQRRVRPRQNQWNGSLNHETRALLFPSFDEDAEDNQDDPGPIPTIAVETSDQTGIEEEEEQQQQQPANPIMENRWVQFLPLAALCAGIVKAFQNRTFRRRRRFRTHGNDEQEQDMSVPLMDLDNLSNDEEQSQHEKNFQSLLVCWLPFASVLIGLLSALLGIGGGEILGPILLLLLKMDPQESSATTAIMSLMNSGTNLLLYVIADLMVAPGYAINLGLAGLLGGSFGRIWAVGIAQQGRSSIIAMSLFLVLFIATLLVAWELLTTPVSWESTPDLCRG